MTCYLAGRSVEEIGHQASHRGGHRVRQLRQVLRLVAAAAQHNLTLELVERVGASEQLVGDRPDGPGVRLAVVDGSERTRFGTHHLTHAQAHTFNKLHLE